MYGAETDVASIINAARRFPMMSKYQLVVVREAQLIRDIELLSNYVKNPLMSTVLVINYKYKNLDRRKALASATDKTGVLFRYKQKKKTDRVQKDSRLQDAGIYRLFYADAFHRDRRKGVSDAF